MSDVLSAVEVKNLLKVTSEQEVGNNGEYGVIKVGNNGEYGVINGYKETKHKKSV
jgi:hypothetical protein